MKKKIAYIIIIVALAGIVTAAIHYQQPSFIFSMFEKVEITNNGKTVSYDGEDGKTALELLQKNATVLMSGTGKNAFVTSINDTAANSSNQFWALKVNGKDSMVGAGSLITKDSDTITWELTTF